MNDPLKYGRIIRNANGEFEKIVEFKDCNEEEVKVKEINSGMYCFNIQDLLNTLGKLNNNNNQGEYYLTDVLEILKKEGKTVGAVAVDVEEITAVNSRAELAVANEIKMCIRDSLRYYSAADTTGHKLINSIKPVSYTHLS